MGKLKKFLDKYWIILSVCSTVVSSGVMWGLHTMSRIDAVVDQVKDTASWVQDNEDEIKTQHDDILKLKEDERLREAGLLK